MHCELEPEDAPPLLYLGQIEKPHFISYALFFFFQHNHPLCLFTSCCLLSFFSLPLTTMVSDEFVYATATNRQNFSQDLIFSTQPAFRRVESGGCVTALLRPITSCNVGGSEDINFLFISVIYIRSICRCQANMKTHSQT